MGKRESGGRDNDYRTSNHNYEIETMRQFVKKTMDEYPDIDDCPDVQQLQTVVCAAAAALLECHDATGISLDNWEGPRELVIQAIWIIGGDTEDFVPNGV